HSSLVTTYSAGLSLGRFGGRWSKAKSCDGATVRRDRPPGEKLTRVTEISVSNRNCKSLLLVPLELGPKCFTAVRNGNCIPLMFVVCSTCNCSSLNPLSKGAR